VEKHPVTSIAERIAARYIARFYPWILAGLAILYLITFPILKAPILVSVPAIMAGWFYYRRGGLIASILAFIANLILINMFPAELNWNTLFSANNGFLTGHILVITVSISIGYLREVFEGHFRLDRQLRLQERFLTLLSMIIKRILDSNGSDGFYYMLQHVANLFVADSAYITRWDEVRKKVKLLAATYPIDEASLDIELNPQEAGITEDVLQTGRVLVIDDMPNTAYIFSPMNLMAPSRQPHSAICIPLIAGEYKFGMVALIYETAHRFTQADNMLAEQTGHQIALALRSLRQDEINRQQLNETRALMRIGQALSETERVGSDTVLQLIVDSARDLIPQAEQAVIHLLEEDDDLLTPQAISGFDQNKKNNPYLRMQKGDGVAGQVLRDGVTINIGDIRSDPRFLQAGNEPSYRSLLVAPVQTSGRQLGTISVESKNIHAFSEHEADLLRVLGGQAAIAIENTSLLETTAHSLMEVNALFRINQRLAESLDADVLMKEAVDLLQQNFQYYHVQVYLLNPGGREAVLKQGSGEIGRQLKNRGHYLLPGAGIVGHVAHTGRSFLTNDVDRVIFFVHNPLLPGIKSELAAPIKVEGEILGVLDVLQVPPGSFTDRDQKIISAVAEQLAVALQKANLYADLQSSLQHEQAMRTQLVQNERLALIGQLLASISHELNNPLQTIQNAMFLLKEESKHSGYGEEELDIISSETDRMVTLLTQLRSTYRPLQADEFGPVQVNDILEYAYKLVSTHLRHHDISFEFQADPSLPPAMGIPDHIKQVALNLLMNSVDAMPGGGKLFVETCALPAEKEVAFSIADTGYGIDPSLLPRIFDPFVTSKETGTGLGLTITHEIVQQHRGRIQAENVPGGGAKFTVWLPIWKEESP